MTINETRDLVFNQATKNGWWTGDVDFLSKLCLVHSEISEACEEYRQYGPNKIDDIWYDRLKPEGVPIELADTIIRILDICGYYGIDIEEAISKKMAYNNIRTYRHGNKYA